MSTILVVERKIFFAYFFYLDFSLRFNLWKCTGTLQGRTQDLARGGQDIFFSDLKAMRFARGILGHTLPIIFLKMVRFGVYLDQILSLKVF